MGRAICERLAAEGARVAVLARGRQALDETVDALGRAGSPDSFAISVDVTDRAQVDDAFAQIGQRWASLNVLVNTLGPGCRTVRAARRLPTGMPPSASGSWPRCGRAGERCPCCGAAEWARIVNFSAHSTQRQSPLLVAYTAVKAALTSFSKNLSKSLAKEGILVNTVSPGSIVTASFSEGLRSVFDEEGLDPTDPYDVMDWIDRHFHQPADLGRAGLPDEVASLVAYLASRTNGYVTGADVNVDGGSDFV